MKQDNKEQRCNYCNNVAISSYTTDLDIKGISFCQKHKEQARFEFLKLMGLIK